MPVPLISALPTVPSYDNTNFESLAPAFLSFLKNTFQAEMNAAIAAINNYDYGAAVNASIITGQVAVANGGTGLSTLAAGRIPYGADSDPFASSGRFRWLGYLYLLTENLSGDMISSFASPYVASGIGSYYTQHQARAGTSWAYQNIQFSGGGTSAAAKGAFYYYANRGSAVDMDTATPYLAISPYVLWHELGMKVGGEITAPAKKLEVEDDSGAQLRLTHSSGDYTDFQTDGDGNLTIAPSGGGALSVTVPIKPPSYTVATAPSASTAGAGAMIYVTDDVGGAVIAFSDGTNWLRVTDRAIVSTT